MPSQLETTIAQTRRLMAAEDAAAQSRMVAVYADAIEGLDVALARLATVPVEEMPYGQLVADARYRQLLAEAEASFDRFANDGQRVLLQAQRGAVNVAHQTAVPLMRAAAPDLLAASFVRLPEAALQELVGTLGPGSPVRAILDRFGTSAAQAIESEFIQGIAAGRNSRVIAARIVDAIGGEMWQAERLARTETHRPFRSSLIKTYQQHGHLLDGWKWSAAKGERTCLACLALDGTIFPLSTSFMGNHPNCRCSPSPYRRGGPSENLETGEQWFMAQPERTQRRMLPVGAWDPFQDGTLTLADFVQRDNDLVWGATYREASLETALGRAEQRRMMGRAA